VLAPGSDADVVIWDPASEHTISARTHHMRVDYSMFEGYRVTGNARTVLSRGKVIVDEGKWLGRAGGGSYLRREVHGGAWPK
jgi:dihydropyrimidinase